MSKSKRTPLGDPTFTITLTLPLPPSTNRYVRTGRGVHYTPANVLAFRAAVAEAIADQLPGHRAIDYPVLVDFDLYMGRRECDADNRLKGAGDALTAAGFWIDDVLVCGGRTERFYDADNPRLEIVVRATTDERHLAALNMKKARVARASKPRRKRNAGDGSRRGRAARSRRP